jgi:hypothetical protein
MNDATFLTPNETARASMRRYPWAMWTWWQWEVHWSASAACPVDSMSSHGTAMTQGSARRQIRRALKRHEQRSQPWTAVDVS